MDQKTFIKELDLSRTKWESAVAKIRDEKLQNAHINDSWTVKDLIAHTVWFEKEMLQLVRERSLEGASLFWLESPDERNRLIYEANKNRSWNDIMSQYDGIYSQLRKAFTEVSDNSLNAPSQFAMPPDWVPHQVFADNTYNHYDHHLPDLHRILT